MIHNQNRRTFFFKLQDRASKRLCCFWIQVGTGLIENKSLGAQRQNGRQTDLLLLSFGQRMNIAREQFLNSKFAGSF